MSHPLDTLIELMDTQRLKDARQALYGELGTSIEQPSVYFVVSTDNFKAILDSGEIKPRSLLGNNIPCDCSSKVMQNRRHNVFLGLGTNEAPKAPVQIHECLSFFWNPINSTMDAYCRNSIFIGAKDIQIVVLEISLKKLTTLVPQNRLRWASSPYNLASGAFHHSAPGKLYDVNWPWETIFAGNEDGRNSRERKGEFICRISNENGSGVSGIPIQAITKCFVPKNFSVPASKNVEVIQLVTGNFFKPIKKLFSQDKRFYDKIQQLFAPIDLALLVYETWLKKFDVELCASDFDNKTIAEGIFHGIQHVSRVMFWSVILANSVNTKLDFQYPMDEIISDSLWAARIHDLCRSDENEDAMHGEIAAQKYKLATALRCNGNDKRIRHILEAVTYHSRPDDQYTDTDNIIYKILKDADAMDRGRFSKVCYAIDYKGTGCTEPRCNHSGCAYKTLRLKEVFSAPDLLYMAWAAWALAQDTKFAPWSDKNAGKQLINFLNNASAVLVNAGHLKLLFS